MPFAPEAKNSTGQVRETEPRTRNEHTVAPDGLNDARSDFVHKADPITQYGVDIKAVPAQEGLHGGQPSLQVVELVLDLQKSIDFGREWQG